MKMLYLALLVLALSTPPAAAFPVISGASADPPNPWLGQGTRIAANCTDDASLQIARVYAIINGPGIITQPGDMMVFVGQEHVADIDSSLIDRPGQYEADIFCENSAGEQDSMALPFSVSVLTSRITPASQQKAYVNEPVELGLFLFKDGAPLAPGSGIGAFDARVNGQPALQQQPAKYDTTKGWILRLNAPASAGVYTVEASAEFSGQRAGNTTSIDVRQPVEFEITAIDRTDVKPGDAITISMKATDRGSIIQIGQQALSITIGSSAADILEVSQPGSVASVKVAAPGLQPGSYDLSARFDYGAFSKTESRRISYIVPVSGRLVDQDGNAVNAQIRFAIPGGGQYVFQTDSGGGYSGSVPAGRYDVSILHEDAEVTLTDVDVDEFDDPLRFSYVTGEGIIPGISSAGVFIIEAALDYSEAELKLEYDEKKVLDEAKTKAFRCPSWNSAKKLCNAAWEEAEASVDTVKNRVSFTTASLSAYAAGERKGLDFQFKLREQYSSSEVMQIQGLVLDDEVMPIAGATVSVSVKGTQITSIATTDAEGLVELELPVPQDEGAYKVSIAAEKEPYLDFAADGEITVVKRRDITITGPDTIRLQGGESSPEEFLVKNTGEAEMSGIKISISGLPKGLAALTRVSIGSLPVGGEEAVGIIFTVPEGAEATTHAGSLLVEADGKKYEKLFALTVTAEEAAKEQPPQARAIDAPTGSLVAISPLNADIIYTAIAVIPIMGAAYLLRRRRVSAPSRGRQEIVSLLNEMRKEIYAEDPMERKRKR
ncbi:MAG: hypothetical protein HY367_02660 [Candidatus Aenigmarchaeota archaeon]|nr:hypothetical protein [Candidatus Aenigmarchaeota archaeon]